METNYEQNKNFKTVTLEMKTDEDKNDASHDSEKQNSSETMSVIEHVKKAEQNEGEKAKWMALNT